MNTFFAGIAYKLFSLLISFSALFTTLAPPAATEKISVSNPGEARLTAVLWGDPQVSEIMLSRQRNFDNACVDVSHAETGIDALVMCGDIAENGMAAEYLAVVSSLSKIGTVSHFLVAPGNHDVRLRLHSQAVGTITELQQMLDPSVVFEPGEMYYSYEINGYTFIVLATVSSTFEESDIDETEMKWFESELSKAAQDGKPVFVFVHQPLKLTHNLPDAWNSPFDAAGSVGDSSDELRRVMSQYDNVFFITGHLHSGFSENNYEEIGSVHGVNLPSVGIKNGDGGVEKAGLGYMMEVYDDSVVFRARNFSEGVWMPGYDKVYSLK